MDGIFDKYKEAYESIDGRAKDYFADKCLDAIKNPEFHSEPQDVEFHGIHGTIEVFLKTGIGYPKCVSMVRQIGMKVFDKANPTSAMQYVGVMYIQGDELNAFLAGLENVQHTSWEVDRNSEDSKLARLRLNDLYKYLNNVIRALLEKTTSGHMDVDGLEEYFGIDLEGKDESGTAMEIENGSIANVSSKIVKTPAATEQYSAPSEDGSLQHFGETEAQEDDIPLPSPNPDPPHPHPVPPVPPEPRPEPPEPKPGLDANDPRNNSPIILSKKALIGGKRGTGEYTLILESIEERHIRIGVTLSGEETDETPTIICAV